MSTVVKLPQARQDLIDLADYMARDNLAASERFLVAAEKACEQLAGMPGLGSPWESENPALAGLRMWSVRGFPRHVIFYRPLPDGIEIVRVLHAARDLESILGEGTSEPQA